MEHMAVTEFKSHALEAIERTMKTRQDIVLTKHGKPVAKLVPFLTPSLKPRPGKLSHTLISDNDVVSGFGDELWNAAKK